MTNHDTTTDKAYANGYDQGTFIASSYDRATALESAAKARKTIHRLRNRPGDSRSFHQGMVAGITDGLKAGVQA